jgi:hypothetical protein
MADIWVFSKTDPDLCCIGMNASTPAGVPAACVVQNCFNFTPGVRVNLILKPNAKLLRPRPGSKPDETNIVRGCRFAQPPANGCDPLRGRKVRCRIANVRFLVVPHKRVNLGHTKNEEVTGGLRGYARINTDETKQHIRAYPRHPRSFCFSVWLRPQHTITNISPVACATGETMPSHSGLAVNPTRSPPDIPGRRPLAGLPEMSSGSRLNDEVIYQTNCADAGTSKPLRYSRVRSGLAFPLMSPMKVSAFPSTVRGAPNWIRADCKST